MWPRLLGSSWKSRRLSGSTNISAETVAITATRTTFHHTYGRATLASTHSAMAIRVSNAVVLA